MFTHNLAPKTGPGAGRPAPKDYRGLAAALKIAINSSMSVSDLEDLGGERMLELWNKCTPDMQRRAAEAATLVVNAGPPLRPNNVPNDASHDEFAGYSLNDAGGEDGETLRTVAALKNTINGASLKALCALGLDTLKQWQAQVDRAQARQSATAASTSSTSNASTDSNRWHTANGVDEFFGYDLNSL